MICLTALGHDVRETVVAPTCTEQGYTAMMCSRCGSFKENSYDFTLALGHDFYVWRTVEPTETEQGYTIYRCRDCRATEKRDFIPPLEARIQ